MRREPIEVTGEESKSSDESYLCFADFGVSLLTPGLHARNTYDRRNRGTEVIKSPEMLIVAGSQTFLGKEIDRRRR